MKINIKSGACKLAGVPEPALAPHADGRTWIFNTFEPAEIVCVLYDPGLVQAIGNFFRSNTSKLRVWLVKIWTS